MPVSTEEIKLFKAQNNIDGNSNGGREGYVEIVSNQLYNLFPRVTNAERISGITRYRKLFVHNVDDEQSTLFNSLIWIDKLSTADDYFRIALGTDTDTQADIGSYNWYGTGHLNQPATAAATQIEVNFYETDLVGVLAPGDKIYITNLKNADDTDHNSEFNEIDSISWNGSIATINLKNQLIHDYPISYEEDGETYHTRVAIYLELGDLKAHTDTVVANSTNGTFDDSGYPILGDNKGSVKDTITLSFTSATNFDASGNYLGSLGSGDINSDFAPNNPNTSTPYFTIQHEAWGGSWQAGDTLTFELYPASHGVWLKEVVPTGANSKANNIVTVGVYGESE